MSNRIISYEQLRQFAEYLMDDEKCQATIEKYVRDIKHYANDCNGRPLDKATVLGYKTSLKVAYATASANSMIASMNTFFKFLQWNDCFIKQFRVQKKTFASEEKELTEQEYILRIFWAIPV